MSAISSTNRSFLEQADLLIKQHALSKEEGLGIDAIQESLKKMENRLQKSEETTDLKQEIKELTKRLDDFVIPLLKSSQQIQGVTEILGIYTKMRTQFGACLSTLSSLALEQKKTSQKSHTIAINIQKNNHYSQDIDLELLLNEIKYLESNFDFKQQIVTSFSSEKEKADFKREKLRFATIGSCYFKLACIYSYQENQPLKAYEYWEKSCTCLKKYVTTQCGDTQVDYQNWYDLSICYAYRIQIGRNKIYDITFNEQAICLQEGLLAANNALKLEKTPKAQFLKFTFLQLMEDLEMALPESPLICLKDYLDHHPDPFSEEYMAKAITYGEGKARKGLVQEAKDWFFFLLKNKQSSVAHLYLGKISDQQGKETEALSHFQKAIEIDPSNLENRLWHVSQKAKILISEMRIYAHPITQGKNQEVIDIFNLFFSTFSECKEHIHEKTSNYIPLHQLADRFFFSFLPNIAQILFQLQQYKFAITLYEKMLENFDEFMRLNILKESDKLHVYSALGVLSLMLTDLAKAEQYMLQAKALDPSYLANYKNLVAVYSQLKDELKLETLWKEIEPFLSQQQHQDSKILLSGILCNFGSAYLHLGDKKLIQAQQFYRLSLKHNEDNWDARLYLARTLVTTEGFVEAKEYLTGYAQRESFRETPFLESPKRDFQVYFCLAGICALLDEHSKSDELSDAEKWAIEAGKTRFAPEETKNLQAYLKALKGKKTDNPTTIYNGIRTSIRKMEFSCRIGKIINEKSLSIESGKVVGYHGTIDLFADSFKNGVQPQNRNISQFKGTGFYVTPSKDIACYFAMKKAQDEKKGKPILIPIYASQELVGKGFNMTDPIPKETNVHYDFVHAPIDGFEAFLQYYVFENSLKKLKPSDHFECVNWSEENFNKFYKNWERQNCC